MRYHTSREDHGRRKEGGQHLVHVVARICHETYVHCGDGQRAPQICSRCKQVKYPGKGGPATNHRKHCCSDGVRSRAPTSSKDTVLPDWPQPPDVFSDGTHFHPVKFLEAIRVLHEKEKRRLEAVPAMQAEGGGAVISSLEDVAFSSMLHSRLLELPQYGCSLFQLFDYLTLSPPVPELIITHNGQDFLLIKCLVTGESSNRAGGSV